MSASPPRREIAIVGGCGFIGCNLADAILSDGTAVVLVDNLSRPGVERNLAWLKARHGERLRAVICDIRDASALSAALTGVAAVFHLAAQVAVTSSLADPRQDFETNALGTLNVLEAVRQGGGGAPVIFASTNKVYGALADLACEERDGRCMPVESSLRSHGIGEDRPLALCTPYGCSKGAADQYVLDYAASFGLRSAVLRMSCIYGPRQLGTEDQGWVAHFLLRALAGQPVTLYGTGTQVRDILHVADAVAAYRLVLDRIDEVSGEAFNLGGGPANAVSLREVLAAIGRLTGRPVAVRQAATRQGDQAYFVADTRKIARRLGWQATIAWQDGLADLAGVLGQVLDRETPARERRSVA